MKADPHYRQLLFGCVILLVSIAVCGFLAKGFEALKQTQ